MSRRKPNRQEKLQTLFALCDREYIATHTFAVPDEEMDKYIALPIGARMPKGVCVLYGGKFYPAPSTIVGSRVAIGNYFFVLKELFLPEGPGPKRFAPAPEPVLALPEPEPTFEEPEEDEWTRLTRELKQIESRLR